MICIWCEKVMTELTICTNCRHRYPQYEIDYCLAHPKGRKNAYTDFVTGLTIRCPWWFKKCKNINKGHCTSFEKKKITETHKYYCPNCGKELTEKHIEAIRKDYLSN